MLILVFLGFVLAIFLFAAGWRRHPAGVCPAVDLIAMALGLIVLGAAVAARIA